MPKKPSRKITRNGKKPTVDSVVGDILALPVMERIYLWAKLQTINPPGFGFVTMRMMREQLVHDLQKATAESGKRKTSLTNKEWEILKDKEVLSWPQMIAKHGSNLSALRQAHKRATQFFRELFTTRTWEKDDEGKLRFKIHVPTAPAGKARAEMYAKYQQMKATSHAAKPVTPAHSNCACTT